MMASHLHGLSAKTQAAKRERDDRRHDFGQAVALFKGDPSDANGVRLGKAAKAYQEAHRRASLLLR